MKFATLKYSYIVGIGRSGTTLLSKLLNQHRQALVSLEIEFLIFFKHQFENKQHFTAADFALICDFFDEYAKRHPMLKLLMDTKKLHQDLSSSGINNYLDLTKFLHLQFNFFHKPLEELTLIVDKNPSYSLHIKRLLAFTPEAKFVCMVRDYRANILSRKQSLETRSPDTAFNCYRWLFYNKRMLRYMRRYPQQIFMIKYEDLVTAPEKSMEQISSFLGLSVRQEDMHYYRENKQDALSQNMDTIKGMKERYKKTFSDIEKPVFTDRVEKWREELPEKDIRICEALCGNFAETYGYKKTHSLSFFNRLIVKAGVFSQYVRAVYDYQKEFVLYYFSPTVKLSRIKKKYASKTIA